jgi:hypothetical protein
MRRQWEALVVECFDGKHTENTRAWIAWTGKWIVQDWEIERMRCMGAYGTMANSFFWHAFATV